MADVAIIYARQDRAVVESLDGYFSRQGWSVWWDRHLTGDGFHIAIQSELESASCVLVLWSRHSISKEWVLEESRFAKEKRRPIVQVKADRSIVVPIGFGQDTAISLVNGQFFEDSEAARRLSQRIERHAGPPKISWDGKRKLATQVGSKTLVLPSFFCSVSSYESQLQPDSAVRALELSDCKTVLVSAYDLHQPKFGPRMYGPIKRLRKAGSVVMLDSGNYEAYRKSDKSWNKRKFRRVLANDCYDYAFCFDNLKPHESIRKNVSDVITRVRRDQDFSENGKILPIVHIPTKRDHFNTSIAPELFVRIAQEIRPDFIAVPERELGGGVVEKARVVSEIRKALNSTGRYQPIHLLGTGNPLSVAIFAAAGADTFDGLEWCRTAADHETGLLYHFQQYDFFRHQTRSASSPVVRAAAEADGVSFGARVAFHNLEFFKSWTKDVQKDIEHKRIDRLLRNFLPKGFFHDLSKALPGVFDQ